MTETIDTNNEAAEDVVEEVDESATDEAGTEEDNSPEESDAESEGAAEDKEEDAQEAEEDEDAPTRKPRTNADWVALRRQQKLDKQKAEKGEQGEADDESEEDDDVNEEDAKLIDKRIDQRLAPLEEATQAAEIKAEIDSFVADNPDFKPFAAKAAKWAKHPSWKDVPTKQLMFAAAGDKLLKIGATRAKIAAKKTLKTKTGANTGGNSGGSKPVAEMSDAEFEQEIQRVKTASHQ